MMYLDSFENSLCEETYLLDCLSTDPPDRTQEGLLLSRFLIGWPFWLSMAATVLPIVPRGLYLPPFSTSDRS